MSITKVQPNPVLLWVESGGDPIDGYFNGVTAGSTLIGFVVFIGSLDVTYARVDGVSMTISGAATQSNSGYLDARAVAYKCESGGDKHITVQVASGRPQHQAVIVLWECSGDPVFDTEDYYIGTSLNPTVTLGAVDHAAIFALYSGTGGAPTGTNTGYTSSAFTYPIIDTSDRYAYLTSFDAGSKSPGWTVVGGTAYVKAMAFKPTTSEPPPPAGPPLLGQACL